MASKIAQEVADRMREDGIDPQGPGDQVPMVDVPPVETPGSPAREAPTPGSEGGAVRVPPAPATPAEERNTDTGHVDDPGPIPYARFKEVNDRYAGLKDYEYLRDNGYDPDSLGRLAAFEAQYLRDPKTTIGVLVDGLEDLPPETKAAIAQHLGVEIDGGTPPAGAPNEGDGEGSSLSPDDRALLKRYREREEREQREAADAQTNQRLDVVVNAWKAKDTVDKLESPPEHRQLAFISAAAARGGFKSLDELADMARDDWLEERERVLGSAVRGSRRDGTTPPALSGDGVAPAPPQRARTLAEASKLARAAMESGDLPPITGG